MMSVGIDEVISKILLDSKNCKQWGLAKVNMMLDKYDNS